MRNMVYCLQSKEDKTQRDYKVQTIDVHTVLVRDSKGKILVECENETEAGKWIDIEIEGCNDFRELD